MYIFLKSEDEELEESEQRMSEIELQTIDQLEKDILEFMSDDENLATDESV